MSIKERNHTRKKAIESTKLKKKSIFRITHKYSLNSDGLSPLDVAVLSNNRSMTKMLLQNGATEGNKCMYIISKIRFNYL